VNLSDSYRLWLAKACASLRVGSSQILFFSTSLQEKLERTWNELGTTKQTTDSPLAPCNTIYPKVCIVKWKMELAYFQKKKVKINRVILGLYTVSLNISVYIFWNYGTSCHDILYSTKKIYDII